MKARKKFFPSKFGSRRYLQGYLGTGTVFDMSSLLVWTAVAMATLFCGVDGQNNRAGKNLGRTCVQLTLENIDS